MVEQRFLRIETTARHGIPHHDEEIAAAPLSAVGILVYDYPLCRTKPSMAKKQAQVVRDEVCARVNLLRDLG